MLELITKISLWAILIINSLLLLLFICGKVYVFELKKWIKFVALYSVVITGLLSLYICVMSVYVILSLFAGDFLYALIFLILVVSPFVIGRFATYNKIKFYTNIQIIQLLFTVILTAGIMWF